MEKAHEGRSIPDMRFPRAGKLDGVLAGFGQQNGIALPDHCRACRPEAVGQPGRAGRRVDEDFLPARPNAASPASSSASERTSTALPR